MVEHTTTDALRRMQGKEGLVLQGCGGPLDEWVDGCLLYTSDAADD